MARFSGEKETNAFVSGLEIQETQHTIVKQEVQCIALRRF